MIVKLLTEHHLEILSQKGDCRGSSESTHVKIPHCWKSHALAQLCLFEKISSMKHVLLQSKVRVKLTLTLPFTAISRDYTMEHTGNCIRRFGGINAYCRYFIYRKW